MLINFVLGCDGTETEFELTPQDGYYNNLIHPDWGAIGRSKVCDSGTHLWAHRNRYITEIGRKYSLNHVRC